MNKWEQRYHWRIDDEYRAEVRPHRDNEEGESYWEWVIFRYGEEEPAYRGEKKYLAENYLMEDCEKFINQELMRISVEEWQGSPVVFV